VDIESISQLKRFIELNVGNNELLNRELEHLSGF
ncbi:PilZ domain-containing protein, partial [Vibrio parahaemolyticus]|nr:PilZ domain-containing protein [Vibrio parahaemolyticus]